MDDFTYYSVDEFLAHVCRKYGDEFARRNKPILRTMFSESRALTYTEDEYKQIRNRIVAYVGTTRSNITTTNCIGVTN